jgi:Glycosyl hydrolase family 26
MKARTLAFLLLAGLASEPALATPPLGVYEGSGCGGAQGVPVFEKWLGSGVARGLDYFATDSWSDMVSEATWAAQCWSHANLGIKMTFSLPMLPSDHKSTLAQGAAGAYDTYFKEIGAALVSAGYPDAILRVGWEFNGGWYPWNAHQDPANWVAFYRHIVTVMRGVSGSKFKFDWNPTLGLQQLRTDSVYPGDDVVDYIGMDTYDQYWGPGNSIVSLPQTRWAAYVNGSYGLKWLAGFAALHNKPISIPEWGVVHRSDGHGGGDNPYFVNQMLAWLKSNNVGYQDYFDWNSGSGFESRLSIGNLFPLSAAAFKSDF